MDSLTVKGSIDGSQMVNVGTTVGVDMGVDMGVDTVVGGV
jgi:hypothetical protein